MGLCQIPPQTMERFQRPLSLEGRMTTHNWLKWVLPLLTADVMQQKRPWSSPLQWQLSSRLPFPCTGQRLTDAPFPKALSNQGRKKLKVKTLSIPLKTVYSEGKVDEDWDFGEASPTPISALLRCRTPGRLCCLGSRSVQWVWERLLPQCGVMMINIVAAVPWLRAVRMGQGMPDICLRYVAPSDDNTQREWTLFLRF